MRECIRTSDDAQCRDCRDHDQKCTPREEINMDGGRGYGIDNMTRTRAEDGYYITTLELPPSPEGSTLPIRITKRKIKYTDLACLFFFVSCIGALVPDQPLQARRIRLVPFTWQRRRRSSAPNSTPT